MLLCSLPLVLLSRISGILKATLLHIINSGLNIEILALRSRYIQFRCHESDILRQRYCLESSWKLKIEARDSRLNVEGDQPILHETS